MGSSVPRGVVAGGGNMLGAWGCRHLVVPVSSSGGAGVVGDVVSVAVGGGTI
jgi:hypothetical protein